MVSKVLIPLLLAYFNIKIEEEVKRIDPSKYSIAAIVTLTYIRNQKLNLEYLRISYLQMHLY